MSKYAALMPAAAELSAPYGQQQPGPLGIQKMIDDSLQALKDDVAVIKGQHEQLSRQVEGISGRVDAIQGSLGGIKTHMDKQAAALERRTERRMKWVMFATRIIVGGGLARWLAHRSGVELPGMHH